MTTEARSYQLGDVHAFRGGGKRYLYLAESAAIFEIGEAAAAVVDQLVQGGSPDIAPDIAEELEACRAIITDPILSARADPMPAMPVQTLVLNLTNQCNLACQYCYEYGADKVATPEGKPKFMDWETAKASVDFLIAQGALTLQITFFGGETLMNFPLLKRVVTYATGAVTASGGTISFSLTTNGTLLTPDISDFLAEHRIGVTVSMDGPAHIHDQLRVFASGRGSYDIVAPKVRDLIARHHTRPITARVTLTSGANNVVEIYRHLKHDLGFHEVGFAPVTSSPDRLYAINEPGMDQVLGQFVELADDYLAHALRGEHHGFSNVSETLAELHQGVNKSHPCGAGIGLVGIGPSGDIAPCHRFVDSDQHALGNIASGIDNIKQSAFLDRGHVQGKYECQSCFARPLCAGGCHHEAFVRYGDTGHANLHYCDWIRAWTHKCLEIYGALAAHRPEVLDQFSERKRA